MNVKHKSVFECLKLAAEEEGGRRFLFDEEREFSFAQTYEEAVEIANRLYTFGVRCGDLLAFRMTRSLDSLLIFFATQMLGAVAALIDPHQKVEEFISGSGVDIRPRYIVTNENSSSGISANGGWELMDKQTGNKENFSVCPPSEHRPALFNVCIDAKAPSIILFTSGSTGKNKASVLSQEAFIIAEYMLALHCKYSRDDIMIALLPICHMYALSCIVFTCFTIRYELFIPTRTDPETILAYLEKYKITLMIGVPSLYMSLADCCGDLQERKISCAGMTAAAPCTEKQFEYIERKLKIKLFPAYGMTEGINFTALPPDADVEKRMSSVGTVMPMRECSIFNDKGEKMPCGQTGEICVKSPFNMIGYYKDPQATAEVIDKDGYLHTGDLGYFDKDGCLYITGRKKDIIIRNGNNISAVQVKKKIELLESVHDVVVVGIKDDQAGEVPCAAVVLNKGYERSEEQLREELKTVLYKNEMPVQIRILQSLPLLSAGKPDKLKIKSMFEDPGIAGNG